MSLAQAKDQPTTIASNVFARTLYGPEHPYGRVTTEQSVRAITRGDVVAFHRAYFSPPRATITLTTLYLYDLAADSYQTFADRIGAVTRADLDRVARNYVDVDRLASVIVGDRAAVEAPLARTGVAPIVVLDAEGRRAPP